ncbi:Transmembrane protein 14C [Collichthys lucidus]|uniref:Transmembrane protein 14C n=1 Tax=Collichthys lucidus TaxID=240159 RepID=A0A4U5V067_COLLU|nr:Transmembrane protein 14C [Collichthys lucidus]
MSVDWVGFSYAALVSAGGIMGYLKAGSSTSLVAGLLFGLLAAVGAYLASQNPKNVWLSLGNAGTSGTLAVVMGLRFLNSWKFMPAGLMTLASVLVLMKILIGMLKRPHKKS